MNYIYVSDQTYLYFKDWQGLACSTAKRTVVLLSGWPLSADSWDDQAMAIAAAGHRVIAYDRRGFGRSSQPFSGYDYDTLADDLHAVLKQTEAHDVVLIGFSMGGGEVVRYLTRYPNNRVVKAVLIASVAPFKVLANADSSGVARAGFEQSTQAIQEDRAAFFVAFFEKFFGFTDAKPSVTQAQLNWAQNVALQACLPATLGCLHAFSHTAFEGDLAKIKLPLLAIHGSDDRIVPISDVGRDAVLANPFATLLEYPNAPHGLFATHKDRLTQDLLRFLEQ